MRTFSVVTTIHSPSKALRALAAHPGWPCIVVGDRKTPRGQNWPEGVCFLPFSEKDHALESHRAGLLGLRIEDLVDTGFAAALPADHYARKNLGYIAALRAGAEVIYETDDDNQPSGGLHLPAQSCAFHCVSRISSAGGLSAGGSDARARTNTGSPEFVNVYKAFTTANVWPRGLPLQRVLDSSAPVVQRGEPLRVGVWQGLVDGEPDVDAIYRLVSNEPVRFARAVIPTSTHTTDPTSSRGEPTTGVVLPAGRYCPFNSQNTFWFAPAFAALYLPASVSSRVSDILRGYVAQRLLWDCGLHIAFSAPTAVQQRNPHDLMRDFRDELDLYLNSATLCRTLAEAALTICDAADLPAGLIDIYARLVSADLVPARELPIVRAWAAAFERAAAVLPERAAA